MQIRVKVELLTGTAGVPPAMSAQRERVFEVDHFAELSHLAVLVAGEGARGPSEELESNLLRM